MIKSRIAKLKNPPQAAAPSGPWLGRLNAQWAGREYSDYTVLFYDGIKGVVVQAGVDAPWPVGYHSEGWLVERFTAAPASMVVKMRNTA